MADPRPEDRRNYWKRKGITSFGNRFPKNYDGPTREFWERQLTGEIEIVVDVGCGNGAVTWIADEILRERSGPIRIVGVDYSDIDPFDALERAPADYPRCSFMPQTPAEQLPFADASVNVVISSYGIEYSDLDRSIPEVVRVLKPSGRMAFIMHDRESSVVRTATLYQDDMKAVDSLGIDDLALQLFELGRRLPTPAERQASPEFGALTARLNELTAQVRSLVQDYLQSSPIHEFMNRIMRPFADPRVRAAADPGDQIRAARDALRTQIRKNDYLLSAALTEDDRRHLVGLIEGLGWSVSELGPIGYRHERNIGTTLVATARAG